MAKHDRPQTSKSKIINLWSIFTIILPIIIIVRFDWVWDLLLAWGAVTGLMLLVPPIGWIRQGALDAELRWDRLGGMYRFRNGAEKGGIRKGDRQHFACSVP
ncbi:unnamed protein product [Discosporangium mesarthrocarpum]